MPLNCLRPERLQRTSIYAHISTSFQHTDGSSAKEDHTTRFCTRAARPTGHRKTDHTITRKRHTQSLICSTRTRQIIGQWGRWNGCSGTLPSPLLISLSLSALSATIPLMTMRNVPHAMQLPPLHRTRHSMTSFHFDGVLASAVF
jgi:hypothetical protein